MVYRPCGRSGLQLPLLSLGLWHNFGDTTPLETQQAIVRTAFDAGITHFDLANNYGPPYGSAETNFGRILREDLAALPRRADHLEQGGLGHVAGPLRPGRWLAQVRAGQPGPEPAARRASTTSTSSTRTASTRTRRSTRRWAPSPTPCDRARRCMSASRPTRPARPARRPRAGGRGRPAADPPARYNLFNRWVEAELARHARGLGTGMIAFTALAQGLLTDKYLDGIPANARVNRPGGDSFPREPLPKTTWHGSERSTRSRRAVARRSPRWPTPGCSATRGSRPR